MITSKKQNKIVAVIPFYNEENHLGKVINQAIKFTDMLILVDDGSTDSSVLKIPKKNNIILLKHKNNLGKGSALRTGLEKSRELKSKITITLDADMQHAPEYIPSFIKELDKYDCVIGKREKNKTKMPIQRKLSNYITSRLLSLKTGVKIIDSQSGYRAFKTEILDKILPEFKGFEAESEMIVKLARQNFKIGFVKIPTIYGDDNSKMKPIEAIVGFLKVILKT